MSDRHSSLARQLAATLGDRERAALASAPRAFLEARGIRVRPLRNAPGSELCTCDGVFFELPSPNIGYRPTPGSR